MGLADLSILFATASPRRRALAQKIKFVCPSGDAAELLRSAGFARLVPVFMSTDADEITGQTALATATANARLKGESAAAVSDLPVLAFDTVVGIGDCVLGKPDSRADAVRMFEMLCGNTHEVITAVYFRSGDKIIQKNQRSYVTFGAFDGETVYNYIDSGAPYDKAGGYNIDDPELGSLIIGFDGDYDNIVGLPVGLTEKLIEEFLIYVKNGNRY